MTKGVDQMKNFQVNVQYVPYGAIPIFSCDFNMEYIPIVFSKDKLIKLKVKETGHKFAGKGRFIAPLTKINQSCLESIGKALNKIEKAGVSAETCHIVVNSEGKIGLFCLDKNFIVKNDEILKL